MNNIVFQLVLELALFCLLGFLYYLYQKRKILAYEADKMPRQLGLVLQVLLQEHDKKPDDPILNQLIEEIDKFLHGENLTPPLSLLKVYCENKQTSNELRILLNDIIEDVSGKK